MAPPDNRGLLPTLRNTFSNANRTRDPAVAEKLFWEMYGRLASLVPKFVHPKQKGRLARSRLRRIVSDGFTNTPCIPGFAGLFKSGSRIPVPYGMVV